MALQHLLRTARAATIGAAVAFGAAFGPAQAAVTIFDPGGSYAGKSIADWTAAWWSWVFQQPYASNAVSDTTGASANQNNNGPVFFIAGTDGVSLTSATRSFSVPDGRPILFPMITAFDVEPPLPPPPIPPLSDRIATAEAVVSAFLSVVNTASLFATIDGTPVANPAAYLEVTGIFSAGTIAAGSYLDGLYPGIGLPGLEAFPMKAGGYWLMISGLTPGPHVLSFGGTSDPWAGGGQSGPATSTNTTALITVPEPGSALLLVTTLALLLVPSRLSARRS